MAKGMNIQIANTYRKGGQLQGLQMTTGNIIAIVLSAAQIVAGVLVLLTPHLPDLLLLLLIPVGILFAWLSILIERLSITSLTIIRSCSTVLRNLREQHYQEAIGENREMVLTELSRRIKASNKERGSVIPIMLFGMLTSAGLGDIFFHWVFGFIAEDGQLASLILSYVLSSMAALVISGSLVLSELYKDLIDRALIENVQDTRVVSAVLANEQHNMQLEMAIELVQDVRNDPKLKEQAQGPMQDKFIPRLAESIVDCIFEREEKVTRISEEKATTPLNTLPAISHKQTAIPAHAESKEQQTKLTAHVSTGEFATMDNDSQTLYKALQQHPQIISTMANNANASVEQHVDFLTRSLPDCTFTAQSVQDVLAVIVSEETDTDKLIQTDPGVDQAIALEPLMTQEELFHELYTTTKQQHGSHGYGISQVLYNEPQDLIQLFVSYYPDYTAMISVALVQQLQATLKHEIDEGLIHPSQVSKPSFVNDAALTLYRHLLKNPEMKEALLDAINNGADVELICDLAKQYITIPVLKLGIRPAMMELVIEWLKYDQVHEVTVAPIQTEVAQLPEIAASVAPIAPRKTTTRKQPTAPRKKRQFEERSVPAKTKYTHQVEDDLMGMLSVNPDLTLGTIEGRYNISENTARAWRNKAKTAIKIRQSEAQEA